MQLPYHYPFMVWGFSLFLWKINAKRGRESIDGIDTHTHTIWMWMPNQGMEVFCTSLLTWFQLFFSRSVSYESTIWIFYLLRKTIGTLHDGMNVQCWIRRKPYQLFVIPSRSCIEKCRKFFQSCKKQFKFIWFVSVLCT